MAKRVYKKRLWTVVALNIGTLVVVTVTDSRPENVFRGIKVGIKGGVYQHDSKVSVHTSAGGASRQDAITLSGHTPFFGMQFEADIPWMSNFYLGGMVGYEGSQGHVQSKTVSTVPVFHFKQSLKQKIETALIMGAPYAELFPYVKIGAVWGQFHMKANNGTGSANVKEFRPGFVVGAGLDFKASAEWMWGTLVQYEQYNRMKSPFLRNNGGTPFSSWSARPALLSAQIHLKRKINVD